MTGGHWNRAGRRSGGARPFVIDVAPEYTCAKCGTETAFGLLEQRVTYIAGQSVRMRCCPKGCGVLLGLFDGRWISPYDLPVADAQRPHTPEPKER